MKIEDRTGYEASVFDELEFKQQRIEASTFEQCRFIGCDFSEAEFINCRFRECEFTDTNLNVARFDGSRFVDTEFKNCKVTGINWTSLDWSSVALSSPLYFDACDVSFSVFNSLQLPGLGMTRCKARDVDFGECDLSGGDFFESNLSDARFNRTRLDNCNFKEATGYFINPLENTVAGASFTLPDVLGLLSAFKIKIDDFG